LYTPPTELKLLEDIKVITSWVIHSEFSEFIIISSMQYSA